MRKLLILSVLIGVLLSVGSVFATEQDTIPTFPHIWSSKNDSGVWITVFPDSFGDGNNQDTSYVMSLWDLIIKSVSGKVHLKGTADTATYAVTSGGVGGVSEMADSLRGLSPLDTVDVDSVLVTLTNFFGNTNDPVGIKRADSCNVANTVVTGGASGDSSWEEIEITGVLSDADSGVVFRPGSDDSVMIFLVDVSGLPSLRWDEDNNRFKLTKNLEITSDNLWTGRKVIVNSATFAQRDDGEGWVQIAPGANYDLKMFEDATSGKNPEVFIFGYPTGGALDSASFQIVQADGTLEIKTHDADSDILLTVSADDSVITNGRFSAPKVTITEATNGLKFDTDTDESFDIFVVDVTGSPKMWWDETSDEFELGNDLNMWGNITMQATGYVQADSFVGDVNWAHIVGTISVDTSEVDGLSEFVGFHETYGSESDLTAVLDDDYVDEGQVDAITKVMVLDNIIDSTKIWNGGIAENDLAAYVQAKLGATSDSSWEHATVDSITVNEYAFLNTAGLFLDADGDGVTGGDSGEAVFGEGQDLYIFHGGTHSYITNTQGDLYISDVGGDDVILSPNGGKVGVNETNPTEILTVDGRISITTDPNSDDDVGDKGYNDTQYVNEGQSSSVTSDMITNAEIVNADINASAGIQESKFSISSGAMIYGSAGGVGIELPYTQPDVALVMGALYPEWDFIDSANVGNGKIAEADLAPYVQTKLNASAGGSSWVAIDVDTIKSDGSILVHIDNDDSVPSDDQTFKVINDATGDVLFTINENGNIYGGANITVDNNFIGDLTGTADNSDLFDNLNSTQFLRSDADDITSGNLTLSNHELKLDADGDNSANSSGGDLFLGEGQDLNIHHNGTNSFIYNSTGYLLISHVAGGDVLLSTEGGKVGVGAGMTSPTEDLEVDDVIKVSGTAPAYKMVDTNDPSGRDNEWWYRPISNGKFSIYDAHKVSDRLSIDSTGQVSIGQDLDVGGSITGDDDEFIGVHPENGMFAPSLCPSRAGTLYVDADSATTWRSYYKWVSGNAALQQYAWVYNWTIPADFTAWATTNAVRFRYKTSNATATNCKLEFEIFRSGTSGADTTITGKTSTSWATETVDDSNLNHSYSAGDKVVFVARLWTKTGYTAFFEGLEIRYQR